MTAEASPSALTRALLAPGSVALIGASDDPRKNTGRPLRFLRRHGYAGRVFPVNARRDTVLGERAWPTVAAIGERVDHALVMVPAAAVADAVADCARAGVPLVTVYTDGFAEAGEAGAAEQARITQIAREGGVRLLGPNSIGVISTRSRLALTVNAALEGELGEAGDVAFVSQSGSMLGAVLSRGHGRGLRFSHLVSVGNEADLGVAEIVECLVGDPDTRTILLFLEAVRDGPRLARAARAAFEAGKTVVAFKLGRSAVGERLAQSHTGALAGSDAVADALLRDAGIPRVEMIETLLEIAPLLRGLRPPARRPLRVALVSTTGGGAAMVADGLGARGVEVATPDHAFVRAMADHGVTIRPAPVIDLTLAATAGAYRTVLEGLIAAPFCDAVVAVVGTSAQFQPELAVEPIRSALGSTTPGSDAAHRVRKPVAVFLAPDAQASLDLLARAGIAAFRTPEACADALAAYSRWQVPAARDLRVPPALRDTGPVAAGRRVLDESTALGLADAIGLPTVERRLLSSPPWRHDLSYPVVAKLAVPGLSHKTEVGAVTLDIGSEAELGRAVERMTERLADESPGAVAGGVLVQRQLKALAEVLLGYRMDPAMGPVVVLGAGGRLAERLGDLSMRMAPVTAGTAREMIGEVRALSALTGYRGMERGDLDALVDAIVRVSLLATGHDDVVEFEVNPLMVMADGVVAVDALGVTTNAGRAGGRMRD